MNWIRIAITLLLLPQAQPTRPEDRASIEGFVVKMGSGEPVSKARVVLSRYQGRGESYQAATTSGGQFVFQSVEPGQYRLSVTRNGYVRMEFGARSPNRSGLPINLQAGQKVTKFVLPILPAGTIAGRVFDRDGEPLANVTVQAYKYTYQEGQRVMSQVQQARTNDLGEYRLFWLQPGQYFVSATPPDQPRITNFALAGPMPAGGRGSVAPPAPLPPPASNETPIEEGYIPVYYPGTTEAQSAAPINLQAGVIFSGVDLTVASVRTLRVRGQVITATTGQPARNATILLVPRQRAGAGFRSGMNRELRSRNINEQGMFEISGVVPGSYDLIGMVNDRNARVTARVPLEIGGADVENVTVLLSPGFALPGRLAIEGHAANATNDPDPARLRVMLRPDAGITQMAGAPPASQVQPNGTFTLQQVGSGDYRLSVTGMPRNAYVKAARIGGIDVLSEGIRVERQITEQLEILVGTNTGTLDGAVTDEKQEPAINVQVVLIPDAAHRTRWDRYRSLSTDALGKFHVEGIPPGDYKVFAWEDVEIGAWQDPDFIRLYEDRGKPLRIGESGQANIDLRVIPPQV